MKKSTNHKIKIEKVKLFEEKKNCCACGACMNICSNQAITMKEDKYGYLYPDIDESKCISCKACKRVCAYQSIEEENKPIDIYVSSSKDNKQMSNSASGGIFAAFATKVLKNGGIVFGATFDNSKGVLEPIHIGVIDEKNLLKLQGSKYVQSSIGTTYQEAKNYLCNGKMVLFSGTPCQIAGLKSYLGKNYVGLITVDIICHGVPSAKFFQDYLKNLETILGGKIINFKFRDKFRGWGLNGKVIYITTTGKKKEKIISCQESSYYNLFLKADIYRENCYECKYACNNRVGDISIGDYWGIEKEHSELLEKKGGAFSIKKGISCVMVNTNKGKKYFEQFKDCINIEKTTFKQVARKNEQLNFPSQKSDNREKILEIYKKNGYEAVEKFFRKRAGLKIYIYKIKNMLPIWMKNYIKMLMRK